MPTALQTEFRTDWVAASEPPSPAQAGPILHNQAAVITQAKRETDEDPTQVRMAYLPIFEPKIEDPSPSETRFVANCNDLFIVNDSLLMVNNKATKSCCHLL